MVERVLADQRRRDVAGDDAERSQPAQHRRRLADPGNAVVAIDALPGAALRRFVARRPANLEGLDVFDLHATRLFPVVIPGRGRREPGTYESGPPVVK